jgi:hypothetical protein
LASKKILIVDDEKFVTDTLEGFFSNRGYQIFKAEDGHHDDLVMSLVFFAWLTRQEYFADLIEQGKFNYEEGSNPEDDNILISPQQKNEDDGEEFVQGGVIWYPA